MEWISVDNLPDNKMADRYLVLYKNKYLVVWFYPSVIDGKATGEWMLGRNKIAPEYWLPLPEMPRAPAA